MDVTVMTWIVGIGGIVLMALLAGLQSDLHLGPRHGISPEHVQLLGRHLGDVARLWHPRDRVLLLSTAVMKKRV
ncbi:MAG: hypothetical protein GY854_18980 [Deltaproteobacteria bacterium]|nr:hypothetical protein [Deltaproteobacteria bacterium]